MIFLLRAARHGGEWSAAEQGRTMRSALWAIGCLALIAGVAGAEGPRLTGGQYSGAYVCSQGLTGMTVELHPAARGQVDAIVVFYAHPDNPDVPSGCYAASGRYDAAQGRLVLEPGAWIVQPSDSWRTTVLDGALDSAGNFNGRIIAREQPSACTWFRLKRGATPLKPPPERCTRPALVG
jgi:hypothetical protein